MDWHGAFGAAAGIIVVVAVIPYLRDIVRGEARPNVVSWSLWTVVVTITALAQVSAGASWSFLILLGSLLACLAVLSLCFLGYGYRKFETADAICFLLACLALLFWWMTANPVVAIFFAIAADAIAYVPTYVKVYREPESESYFYWSALVAADVLGFISVFGGTPANTLFPLSYGLLNSAVLIVAFFRTR